MTARDPRATDPAWQEKQADRARNWAVGDYPGPEAVPFVRKPDFDADENCTFEGCGHPKSEHGRWTGCGHPASPGSMAFCFCPRKVWA